jgi:hypothetical protein
MKTAQLKAGQSIISGLNYLLQEADRNKLNRVSMILHSSIRDICTCLENGSADGGSFAIYDTDLFMAMRFLSKFASVKDEDLKQEILQHIERVNRLQAGSEAADAAREQALG